MASDREALERAAAGWGVELEYTDTWGRTHAASDETLRGALAALGIPLASDQDLERAATARDLARWSRAFDPTVVVFEDSDAIPLRIPAERAGGSVKLEFRWENGEIEHHWFWLPELPGSGAGLHRRAGVHLQTRAFARPAAGLPRSARVLDERAGAGGV